MVIVLKRHKGENNRDRITEKVLLSLCRYQPFNLCFLCMYWQVIVTVNMHIHSRPTEQISTAHRYTSATQKNMYTHISPTVHQLPIA